LHNFARISIFKYFKVTHLWEYDSLDHRASIRAKLAADPEWVGEYVKHLVPMLDDQVNSVVYEPDWVQAIKTTDTGQGPYLMDTITLTKDAKFLDSQIKEVIAQNSGIVNVLYTDIGPKNEFTVIRQMKTLENTQNRLYPGLFYIQN
jgi:hypothetical protein